MTLCLRLTEPADAPEVGRLLRARAASDGEPTEYMTDAAAARDICGPEAWVSAAVADRGDGALGGVVTWHRAYEAAYAARGAYVPELFVDEGLRRRGAATALLSFAAQAVRRDGGGYLWILSRKDNEGGRALYRRLADIETEEIASYAIALQAFDRLCAAAPPGWTL